MSMIDILDLWLHIVKCSNGECKITINCSYNSLRLDKHLYDQIIIKKYIKISFTMIFEEYLQKEMNPF